MTTNQSNNTALANLKFANNSKDNWDTFKADFKDLLTHTKGKLDTVAFDNKLHRTVLKKIEAEVRAEQKEAGITSTAAITAAIQDEADEVLEESQSEAFSYLCMCITDVNLKKRLRRDHDGDAHAAIKYIDDTWAVAGKDTRVNKLVADRTEFLEEGIAKPDAPTVKAKSERLLQFNAELDGTPHHMADSLLVTTMLDMLAASGGQAFIAFVRTFKAANTTTLTDYNKTMIALEADLEENDRMEKQAATRAHREALSVQLEKSRKAEADATARLNALQAQVNALTANLSREEKNALRTGTGQGGRPPPPPCVHCGFPHGGECIGMLVSEGKISREAGMAKFPRSVPDERRGVAVDAAVGRYERAKAAKGADTQGAQVPPGSAPPRVKLGCPARVVDMSAYSPDIFYGEGAHPAALPHRVVSVSNAATDAAVVAQPGGTGLTTLRYDSQCEQHMFCDRAYFPYGTDPHCNVSVRVADGQLVPADGVGTAVVWFEKTGAWVEHKNALLVLGLRECLVSTQQAYAQGGMVTELEPRMRLTFPGDGGDATDTVVPLDAGYTLQVRAPSEADARRLASEDTAPPHVLTRGKHPGRTTADLRGDDLQHLWRARLGVSAGRLRALPDCTDGVPDELRRAKMEFTMDDTAIGAVAPRVHPAPVNRPETDRPGRITVSDLKGPLPASKFGGSRYAAQFTDVHLGTPTFPPMRTKDQYPDLLEAYFTYWEGRDGYSFQGGTLFIDNEWVLNSAKVKAVCLRFGVSITNSCEYEPWQNGICERGWRTFSNHVAEASARGFDDEDEGAQYWPHSAQQAQLIEDRVTHGWEGGGDVTPYEKRTGRRPDLSGFRPMYCLAFVRRPPALRTNKTGPQWDRAMHLGTALTKPGYAFEMLEGPRAGKVVYASQAVFRELVFPRKQRTGGGAPTEPTETEADGVLHGWVDGGVCRPHHACDPRRWRHRGRHSGRTAAAADTDRPARAGLQLAGTPRHHPGRTHRRRCGRGRRPTLRAPRRWHAGTAARLHAAGAVHRVQRGRRAATRAAGAARVPRGARARRGGWRVLRSDARRAHHVRLPDVRRG